MSETKCSIEEEFLKESSLYESITYDEDELEKGEYLLNYDAPIDAYCPKCEENSIFVRPKGYKEYTSYNFAHSSNWTCANSVTINYACSRDSDHKLIFVFLITGYTIEKIGQSPSMADLKLFGVKKYSKVLNKEQFKYFTKAMGLFSHGIGVGSLVYLRRIFEFLVEEAHEKAKIIDTWDEKEYIKSNMGNRIKVLKSELPDFLVANKSMYSILSKGIHELSENECLEGFRIMKNGIEFILDEKLENERRKRKKDKEKETEKDINELNKKHSN